MDNISQNLGDSQEAKNRLTFHIERRNKIKEMYRKKGVQMLDKPELVISDIIQPKMKPSDFSVFSAMQSELTQRGYSEFRFLGQGQQGLVLLAKDNNTNIRYAIKGVQDRDLSGKVNDDLNYQVRQEIEILQKCKGSPYVVSLLDTFEGKQFTYLVLNECQGTLKELIEKNQNKRLNEISVIKYAKDIAEGLYHIHSKSCLVNDLKPENILIDYYGNAVISDFGYADNLIYQSGYTISQYMGNFKYQAPECYDPKSVDGVGKAYYDEYQKLGVKVKQEPSKRSEACSLGYLIYTLIQEVDYKFPLNKHKKLNYDDEFSNFVYHKQLKQLIDGLTNFIPRERLPIKEALILLKGIISFEFQLDNLLIETIDENTKQLTNSLNYGIEFVKIISNKFYPIIQNEQTLKLNLKKDHQKMAYVAKIKELEKEIKDLQTQLQQAQNPKKGFIEGNPDYYPIKMVQDHNRGIILTPTQMMIFKNYCFKEPKIVYDINKKKIGYVKGDDWEKKDKMMIFYEDEDCKKQIGIVYLRQKILVMIQNYQKAWVCKDNLVEIEIDKEIEDKEIDNYQCEYEYKQ